MKILFLTNNQISDSLVEWLQKNQGEKVIVREKKIDLPLIKKIQPDFVISYSYRYLIKKDVIDFMNEKIINLHISYLPYNRGSSPNIWSFLENTPKGVTIHVLDQGLDTGDILAQTKLDFDEEKETLKSSYYKLHQAIQRLFKEKWSEIRSQKIIARKQVGAATLHTVADLDVIRDKILQSDGWEIKIATLKQRYKKIN